MEVLETLIEEKMLPIFVRTAYTLSAVMNGFAGYRVLSLLLIVFLFESLLNGLIEF